MSSVYKDRYGIPGADVKKLMDRFYKYYKDSDWLNADSFVRWCSENGWKKGLRIDRADTTKPHGPENSFFKAPDNTTRATKEDIRRRKEYRKNLTSPFCEGCQKKCRASTGCDEYQRWFEKNWDKNIRVAKPAEIKPEPAKPMVFRYEHPDLVREGIVFHAQ